MAVGYKDYYKILGVNLAGVEVTLRLLKRLEVLQQELEQERNIARSTGDETERDEEAKYT